MTTSSAARRPLQNKYDLDVTIVSAKHLKNVNWRNGDLKPYVILWVDPDRRLATKPDDLGSTRPVWNERFVLPLTLPPWKCALTLEVFHSNLSETPKPLVGTLVFDLLDLRGVVSDSHNPTFKLRTLELLRPSGRPHGKVRLKVGLIYHPMENYYSEPPPGCYYLPAPLRSMLYEGYSPMSYSSLPPPPSSMSPSRLPPPPSSMSPSRLPPPQQANYDPHTGYYSPYYSPQLPPSRSYFERQTSYGAPERQASYGAPERQASYGASERQANYGAPGPSAPVDYTPYDYHKRIVGKPGIGMGTGLAVGGLAAGLGGLALEEELAEEKATERVHNDWTSTSRNNRYGDY